MDKTQSSKKIDDLLKFAKKVDGLVPLLDQLVDWRAQGSRSASVDVAGDSDKCAVVSVTWRDAVAFCQWLEKATGKPFRLPTEAEWEKAASWDEKGSQKRIWPWGDTFDAAKCNTKEGKKSGTTPVGAYSPAGDSQCDAADMAGNVWEWTGSLSKAYQYDPGDGRESQNDKGLRVLRGGSFDLSARRARCASRVRNGPNFWGANLGFRVCVFPGL